MFEKMALNTQEREILDKKLSYPFKKWDIIADGAGEIIWKFEKVDYHWWNPEWIFWRYICAEFSQAISKQKRQIWEVFQDRCCDDDVYINRKRHKLSDYYRFATDAEKYLFQALIDKSEKDK